MLIVEDPLSEVVAEKMLDGSGKNYDVANILHWGKNKIRDKIKGINRAAQGYCYFVLTDQDTEDRCPPTAINELPETIHPNLLYRFAVMEIESWVMAHRQAIADFLSIPVSRIPTNTDTIEKPKEHLVSLARKSRSAKIKRDLVPRPTGTRAVGPGYNDMLSEFVISHWDIEIAKQHSPSLHRTFSRLRQFTPDQLIP